MHLILLKFLTNISFRYTPLGNNDEGFPTYHRKQSEDKVKQIRFTNTSLTKLV